MLIWEDEDTWVGDLVQAVMCPINPGIPDQYGPLEAHIYGQRRKMWLEQYLGTYIVVRAVVWPGLVQIL